jgi:hypothetical protein
LCLCRFGLFTPTRCLIKLQEGYGRIDLCKLASWFFIHGLGLTCSLLLGCFFQG